jgi:H(+)-transporting ATP synthase subunit D
VSSTRLTLLRLRRRAARLERGLALLRRRREALVRELFRVARPAIEARAAIAERARRAYDALGAALALHGAAGLRPLGWPAREVAVKLRAGEVFGVPSAEIVSRPVLRRTIGARGTTPGATGPAAAGAATEFETLADILLEAAPRELLVRRLGEALARTSRQVNAIERRTLPELRARIARLRRALDESERDERLRLRRLLQARAGPPAL